MTDNLLAPDIRACIEAADEPLLIAEIADRVMADRRIVSNACFNMARVGILVKSGLPNHAQRFGLGRAPESRGKPAPSEEARKAATAERRKRYEAGRTERRRHSEERKKAQQTREQRKAKRRQPGLVAEAKQAERRSAKEQPSLQKRYAQQKQVKAETVDEWMARTGSKPEKLATGAVSQPLQFIGHKAINEASWRDRA